MSCYDCKNVVACVCYLIDPDDLEKQISKEQIQEICRSMGGFRRKEEK